MRSSKKTSVTQLVDFYKCEKLGVLKTLKKEEINAARAAAQRIGIDHHRQMERAATVDGRCYIATFVYGSDSMEVALLRKFRDASLSKMPGGKLLIAGYYKLSPILLRHIRKDGPVAKMIKMTLDRLVAHLDNAT